MIVLSFVLSFCKQELSNAEMVVDRTGQARARVDPLEVINFWW